ncbi:acyl-CoA carboxylase subunit epsilon [Nocardioides marmoriginsengisoli]|uniref:Acyl-CoA carboxylase subunit epsilon n=1 Tax=Nocardioides marmoriginsengisoli TaxID=661483 RepID=A0A3N0CJ26_9ACTN|nr:acyl-CoA carboxylase subunit epsilon [Nocardioides marmoriginsengisoli]RNL63016.1 acyl-CoA carboxylase subunit epsilon [Nocardioides marmoriginsengisoli]
MSEQPVLRVVTPDATPEEIAALVAVFSAMGSAAAPAKKPVAAWASHQRRLRPAHPHGPGGWRASGQSR